MKRSPELKTVILDAKIENLGIRIVHAGGLEKTVVFGIFTPRFTPQYGSAPPKITVLNKEDDVN